MARFNEIAMPIMFILFTIAVPCVPGQVVDDLTYTIQEEVEHPFVIANLSRDSNVSSVLSSGEIPLLSFRLFTSTGSTLFNLVNSTGILSTRVKIDREEVCSLKASCVLTLTVGIQSLLPGSSFFQLLTVDVQVDDVNDNSPIFPRKSINLSFQESSPIGTSYIIDGATDLDMGVNNSVQSYFLDPTNSIFSIMTERKLDGSKEVSLVVDSKLDRENTSRFELVVVAQDAGQPKRSGRMKLFINVTDVNDNKPQFQHTVYNVTVNETASVNVTIIVVSAVDEDLNENGAVTYRFSSRQTEYDVLNYFGINKLNGNIYPIVSLTPIQGRTKNIVVEAMDGGNDAKVSQCIVQISVLDNVNNPPFIRVNLISPNNTLDLSEAASIGSLVAHFVTEDIDSGPNGEVSCHVQNSSEFSVRQIKTDQYKIVLDKVLDREVKDDYPITLICKDGGRPSLKTFVDLNVLLFDANDNYPIPAQSEYFINVTENNERGTKLLKVEATDADVGENGHVIYKLGKISSTETAVFVNETTGDVIVMGSFDYEVDHQVNLSIIVQDKGTPSLSATVNVFVTIMDTNDNSPYFDEPVYIFNIKENLVPGVFVGKLQGHDMDSGSNGRLNYTIHDNASLPFMLSRDGYLSTKKSIDREKQALYTFQVVAYDEGESPNAGDVQIHVYVLDENDNSPSINLPSPTANVFRVYYRSVPGTEVLHVEATDDDDGDNGKLAYELISENKPNVFIIDQNSGSIFLNKQMKFEDCGNVTLTLKVFDKGEEPKFDMVNFTFVITDGNFTYLAYVNQTEQNMLVVIIIVSVTLVVAIIVLSIVLLLKRIDRRKQILSNDQYGLKNMNEIKYKKGVHLYESGEEKLHNASKSYNKNHPSLGNQPNQGSQQSKDELIVFKMKLAEKYQVGGGDCSFSKETEMSDVMSSVSGETTGCDSGRGASENEGHDEGSSSAPNSPRKQMMTFKGSTQAQSYFKLEQIQPKSVKQLTCWSPVRPNLNATDSLKIKAGENRRHYVNEKNSSQSRDNYYNKEQYLNNPKFKYEDRYCQPRCESSIKQSDLIFTRGSTRDGTHQYIKQTINSPPDAECRYSYHPRQSTFKGIVDGRNTSSGYCQDGDGYSIDTMDDGHSTTTSGSYTVDNDRFGDEYSSFEHSYHVTHLNHNPEDVYV